MKKQIARHLPHFCLLVFVVTATLGAFTGGAWAGLGIGFALIMFFSVWLIERRLPRPDDHVLLFTLCMLVICALLNLRSTQPLLSWNMWERLVTIFLPLSLLTAPAIQKHAYSLRLLSVLPIAVTTGALAIGAELALGGPLLKHLRGLEGQLYQYDRGFSYLVILAFPAMAALWITKRRWWIAPFIIILFIPASLTESRAAKLALVLALLATTAATFLPTLTRRLMWVIPFAAIGWPFAAQKLFLNHHDWILRLPPSWQDRTEIWDYMSYRILEHPMLGWGLASSSKLPVTPPHDALYRFALGPASHPHNAVIQLWVELGLPGLAFGILFALLVLRHINRLKPQLVPFAAGAWVAAFCLAMISYNLWSDSLWAAFALTGLAFLLLQRQQLSV